MIPEYSLETMYLYKLRSRTYIYIYVCTHKRTTTDRRSRGYKSPTFFLLAASFGYIYICCIYIYTHATKEIHRASGCFPSTDDRLACIGKKGVVYRRSFFLFPLSLLGVARKTVDAARGVERDGKKTYIHMGWCGVCVCAGKSFVLTGENLFIRKQRAYGVYIRVIRAREIRFSSLLHAHTWYSMAMMTMGCGLYMCMYTVASALMMTNSLYSRRSYFESGMYKLLTLREYYRSVKLGQSCSCSLRFVFMRFLYLRLIRILHWLSIWILAKFFYMAHDNQKVWNPIYCIKKYGAINYFSSHIYRANKVLI